MERVVLVTGAGSGIGLACALEAARLGFRVVAGTHVPDEVEVVAKAVAEAGLPPGAGAVTAEPLDVTDEERAREVVEAASPWAVVNNAALVNAGALVDIPLDDARQSFEVMVFGPMRLARLALPAMRRGGGGRIVNISSVASETGMPMLGWYQAAKSALSTLSDVLRAEVAHLGVDVVLVEPGVVDTPLWGKVVSDLHRRRLQALEREPYDKAVATAEAARRRGAGAAQVAEVVGAALHAGHPRYRYRVGAGAWALPVVNRVVPTGVRDRVTRVVESL